MAVLLEPGREVHIAATVDVAVAGGGIAGVAAALAARAHRRANAAFGKRMRPWAVWLRLG